MKKSIYLKPTLTVTTLLLEHGIASGSTSANKTVLIETDDAAGYFEDYKTPSGWESVEPSINHLTF